MSSTVYDCKSNICFKNYEKRENNRFCNFYTEGKCHSKIHVHVAINSTLELIVFIKYIPVVLQNLFFCLTFQNINNNKHKSKSRVPSTKLVSIQDSWTILRQWCKACNHVQHHLPFRLYCVQFWYKLLLQLLMLTLKVTFYRLPLTLLGHTSMPSFWYS